MGLSITKRKDSKNISALCPTLSRQEKGDYRPVCQYRARVRPRSTYLCYEVPALVGSVGAPGPQRCRRRPPTHPPPMQPPPLPPELQPSISLHSLTTTTSPTPQRRRPFILWRISKEYSDTNKITTFSLFHIFRFPQRTAYR